MRNLVLLDLVTPADHRHPVGMVHVERRAHLLGEQALRADVGALVALLQNDGALGGEKLDESELLDPVAESLRLQREGYLTPVDPNAAAEVEEEVPETVRP